MSTVIKINNYLNNFFKTSLKNSDNELYNIIKKEYFRQKKGLELIASENIVSKAVSNG